MFLTRKIASLIMMTSTKMLTPIPSWKAVSCTVILEMAWSEISAKKACAPAVEEPVDKDGIFLDVDVQSIKKSASV